MPNLSSYKNILKSGIKTIGKGVKNIITRGLPSEEGLREGVRKLKELQKQKLPKEIYLKAYRKLIENIK